MWNRFSDKEPDFGRAIFAISFGEVTKGFYEGSENSSDPFYPAVKQHKVRTGGISLKFGGSQYWSYPPAPATTSPATTTTGSKQASNENQVKTNFPISKLKYFDVDHPPICLDCPHCGHSHTVTNLTVDYPDPRQVLVIECENCENDFNVIAIIKIEAEITQEVQRVTIGDLLNIKIQGTPRCQ